MTDNRTTELQSLSRLKTAGRLRYWRGTIEMPEAVLHAICDEIQAEHDQAITVWNTRAERTCTVEKIVTDEFGYWVYTSCGHVTLSHGRPRYCSTCGAKVMGYE